MQKHSWNIFCSLHTFAIWLTWQCFKFCVAFMNLAKQCKTCTLIAMHECELFARCLLKDLTPKTFSSVSSFISVPLRRALRFIKCQSGSNRTCTRHEFLERTSFAQHSLAFLLCLYDSRLKSIFRVSSTEAKRMKEKSREKSLNNRKFISDEIGGEESWKRRCQTVVLNLCES